MKITDGSHNPPKKQANGKPMLSAVNISGSKIVFGGHRLISARDFEREDQRTKVCSGDVLLTIVGTIGRAAVVPDSYEPFTLQRSVAVLKPREIDSRFLMHQLQSPHTNAYLNANAKGTAQKGIYLRTLSETPFLLPPLSEQRRIVEKIESLFAQLDHGEAGLREVQKLLARYRQSILKAAVTGQLTADWRAENADRLEHDRDLHTQEWQSVSLGQLLVDIRYGTAKKCHPNVDGIAVLRIPNVANGKLDLQDLKFAELEDKEIKKLSLKNGDILIVRSNGSANLVGRGAVVTDEALGMAFAGYLIRLRVNQDELIPEFLYLVINSPMLRAKIERQARSTSGVHNINSSEIKAINFKLPPIEVQKLIVEYAEEQMAKVNQLEAWCQSELARSTALRQSILKDAFAGKLVSQDPDDDPADELLARIKAARAAETQKTRKKATA